MQKGRKYVWGWFLTLIGGLGLCGIEMESDLLFWTYAIIFSIGIGLCLAGYEE
jgi:hypothetical protein